VWSNNNTRRRGANNNARQGVRNNNTRMGDVNTWCGVVATGGEE